MCKNYYYFHWNREDDGGIAYSSDDDVEFIEDLEGLTEVPFEFILRDGPFQDYLLNDLGWPILSQRFKKILEPFLSNEDVRWVTTIINDINRKQYTGYVLIFNTKRDILDKEKTIFATKDVIVKAVLSMKKINDLDVLIVPDSDFQIIVSEDVKSEIEQSKLTGIEFSKVPCTV